MKFKNIRFLAKANTRRNIKSTSVFTTMLILTISLTLISSFSVAISNGVNKYKSTVSARSAEMTPLNRKLDEDTINEILNIEHVESVSMLEGMRDQMFELSKVSENNKTDEKMTQLIEDRYGLLSAYSLIGDEKREVISGKRLDESPAFSCIIPSNFYPFDDYEDDFNSTVDYIDGETLIGKTLTVKPWLDKYETLYNCAEFNEWIYLPAIEYELKVVGVYEETPTNDGYPDLIFVSSETGKLIEEMAFEAADVTFSDEVEEWRNNSYMRNHYVTVDDYNNFGYVYNALIDMGVDCSRSLELNLSESVFIISSIFSIASLLLTVSTIVLSIINIMQSSIDYLSSKKGEIGLLKAIGYKDHQIFSTMIYEQISVTMRAFFIGATASTILVAIINLINSQRSYMSRIYVVNWNIFLSFLGLSLIISIIVPLVCQLLTFYKLRKIQPKDAMNDN